MRDSSSTPLFSSSSGEDFLSKSHFLDDALFAFVDQLAQQCECPPHVVLLAAMDAVLRRYDGADSDIRYSVESVHPLQKAVEARQWVPSPLNVQASILEGLQTVSETLQKHVPLLHNADMSALSLRVASMEGNKAGLEMQVSFLHEQSRGDWKASVYLESAEPIRKIPFYAEHLSRMLSWMGQSSFEPFNRCDIIPLGELELLLKTGTGPQHPEILEEECLHWLFLKTVERHPERIALEVGEDTLTYRELHFQAARQAMMLKKMGLEPGDFVGLFQPRAKEMIASLLGILLAGGAYVPMDPTYPRDRVEYILENGNIDILLTHSELLESLGDFDCQCVPVDQLKPLSADDLPEELPLTRGNAKPSDPAYVIYTSGSTGRPKGVKVLHSSASHLVKAEGILYNTQPEDRVYQGFSLAFDASVEEVWMALFAGATLVLGTKEVAYSGAMLRDFLDARNITAFSTVPTQLSLMEEAVDSIRILILGGEALSAEILHPWYSPARNIYNTYGPTEATVIATSKTCVEGEVVTIGEAIANYSCLIMDEQQRLVPYGGKGELVLGGPGVAAGYVGLPEMTAQRFLELSPSNDPDEIERYYRSGDLCFLTWDGEVQFIGRIDAQVKIRGYRVELSEIESVLMQHPSTRNAVVAVHASQDGIPQIVAYLVPGEETEEEQLKQDELHDFLKDQLPSYMWPSVYQLEKELPTLPSGKVDRKKLAAPKFDEQAIQFSGPEPANREEGILREVWARLFAPQSVSVEDNFFDLGGHSLLVAQMLNAVRGKSKRFLTLSAQDVYRLGDLQEMATFVIENAPEEEELADLEEEEEELDAPSEFLTPQNNRNRFWTGLAQLLALYPLFAMYSSLIVLPFLLDYYHPDISLSAWITVAFWGLLLYTPFTINVAWLAKWGLLGEVKPGRYKVWSWFGFRFWIVQRLMDFVPLPLMSGTWLLPFYFRLLGAKVGRNVHMMSHQCYAPDLLVIGDDVCINPDVVLMTHRVEGDELILDPIVLGSNSSIGTKSVLHGRSRLMPGAHLGELSFLPEGTTVPVGEIWQGSPAAKTETPAAYLENVYLRPPKLTIQQKTNHTLWETLAFFFVLLLPLALYLPTMALMYAVYVWGGVWWALLATIPGSLAFILLFCGTVVLCKILLLPDTPPGSYPLKSPMAVRRWVIDAMMKVSLMVVQPLYASLFLPVWLRMLGAEIGARSEISTLDHISPDMLRIGDECFVADSVTLGPSGACNGWLYQEETVLGNRTFLGNSSVIPAGTTIGDNCLIGVMSHPPNTYAAGVPDNTNWLGSPSVEMPRRAENEEFDDAATFRPPLYLVMARGLVEVARIVLPLSLGASVFVILYEFMQKLSPYVSAWGFVLLMPLMMFGLALCIAAIVIALKWLLVGRYKEMDVPLWNSLVWRGELVNALCETVAYPFLLRFLRGTPFLRYFFNALGSKIERGVYMDTTEITEFDLIHIGEGAALNWTCTLQTHLFEDRVMKMSSLKIGRDCTVGGMGVVLLGAEMKRGSLLRGGSLLMKGETLPARTHWQGSPASLVPRIAPTPVEPVVETESVILELSKEYPLSLQENPVAIQDEEPILLLDQPKILTELHGIGDGHGETVPELYSLSAVSEYSLPFPSLDMPAVSDAAEPVTETDALSSRDSVDSSPGHH